MEAVLTVLAIAFVHWIADFVCQTHEQSILKSKVFSILVEHTSTYSGVFFIPILTYALLTVDNYFQLFYMPFLFTGITFIFHTTQDYITSRMTSKLYAKQDFHNFFVVIGFDQFLHLAQLLLTYHLLFGL